MYKLRFFLLLFAWSFFYLSVNSQSVTTASLLDEMVDLQALSEGNGPSYSVVQYSSYDRSSVYPDYPGWYANSDGFGGEPIPGFEKVLKQPDDDRIGEYLICDVSGPGAIVRLWTAWIEGDIRMFIDGSPEPVYDGPAQQFFQHTYEAIIGSEVNPEWAQTFAQNTAGYYPVPFNRSLRLEWIGDVSKLHFYHVQVRLYEPGTPVVSFTPDDIQQNRQRLNQVASILAQPEVELDSGLSDAKLITVHLMPGEKKKVSGIQGQAAITRLASLLMAGDHNLALRQTLLEIKFDGAEWGQVQSPLGDFFGAAPGINPYTSLPFTVNPDGWMICRFNMPFRDSAEVFVHNSGDQEVTLNFKLITAPYQWEEESSMYFRARWRVDHDLPADPDAVFDVPYLFYRGTGRMVGAAAFIMNPTNVPSSYGNWWGEGDEKIFIDDDVQAKFIGTGSEDYFNYAWSSSAIFSHAYCGQPRNDGPANRGFVTNYRWHILDNIPFEKSLDFYMELYPHRRVEGFSYARMIYLYASGKGHDDHMPITTKDIQMPEMPENWWPETEGWAADALFYQIEDLLPNRNDLSMISNYLWSDGDLAKWDPLEMGHELRFQIPITTSGNYLLAFTVAKCPGSGEVAFYLDDEPLLLNGQQRHQLHTPYRTLSRNLKSGAIPLKSGLHVIRIRSVDEEAKPVGLDFIWVKMN